MLLVASAQRILHFIIICIVWGFGGIRKPYKGEAVVVEEPTTARRVSPRLAGEDVLPGLDSNRRTRPRSESMRLRSGKRVRVANGQEESGVMSGGKVILSVLWAQPCGGRLVWDGGLGVSVLSVTVTVTALLQPY